MRGKRCFPSSGFSQAWLQGTPAPSWKRDVLCLQRELRLPDPSLAVVRAWGWVPWHLDELVAAASHCNPNLKAQAPAWLDLACGFSDRQPLPSHDWVRRVRQPPSSL